MKLFGGRWVGTIVFAAVMSLSSNVGLAQMWSRTLAENDLKLERVDVDKLPRSGTFWMLSRTNYPPNPCYPPLLREYDAPVYALDGNDGRRVFVIDDSRVPWDEIYARRTEEKALRKMEFELGLISAAEYYALEGGGPIVMNSYTSSDLWLEITLSTNVGFANITLHNTHSNLFYQLDSTLNLTNINWVPGQVVTNTAGLTDVSFTPISTTNYPMMFFRAVASDTFVSIFREVDGFEPDDSSGAGLIDGSFVIRRTTTSGTFPDDLLIPCQIGGTASNGLDYLDPFTSSPLTNTQVIFSGNFFQSVTIRPQEDNLVEFDESVTLRILVTNTYVVDPSNYQATITISDSTAKLFSKVALFGSVAAGIDYHSPSNVLVVSLDSGPFGASFVSIDTNGFVTNWSGIMGLPDEKKIAIAHATANGFTNGTMYFGTGADVGRLSDGLNAQINWISLTNSFGTNDTLLRGSLHVDQSGSFGGNLIVVSGGDLPNEGGGVWSLSATGGVTSIATIPDTHLEGLITLTNDTAKWGPWAGKIIVGAESAVPPAIFAIAPNGTVVTNHFDIQPEDFDVIKTNQDLYCIDEDLSAPGLLKLPGILLTNFVGDLLVTQEGFIDQSANLVPNNHLPKLFILHWDGTNFITRATISRHAWEWFEHATFAPMDIPALSP